MTEAAHVPAFTVTVRPDDGATVIRPAGNLTVHTRDELRRRVIDLLAEGARHFVLDLAASPYVDGAAQGALLSIVRRIRELEGTLVIVHLTDELRAHLVDVHMDQVLPLEPRP